MGRGADWGVEGLTAWSMVVSEAVVLCSEGLAGRARWRAVAGGFTEGLHLSKVHVRGEEARVELEAVGALWLRERAPASVTQNLHPDSASSVTLSKSLSLVSSLCEMG